MLSRIRRKLSFANVMSVVAVFIALGGSAYAVNQVTSQDIKNGAIKTKDLNKRVVAPKAKTANSAVTADSVSTVLVPEDQEAGRAKTLRAEGDPEQADTVTTLNIGETKLLFAKEPYSVSAACSQDPNGDTRVTLNATSSLADWFAVDSPQPHAAGDTANLGWVNSKQPTTQAVGATVLLGPGDVSLSISSATLGVNLEGQGDCIAAVYGVG